VLLGFGLGALVMVGQSAPRAAVSARDRAEALRMRTIEAQKRSAVASQLARDLMEQWSQAEDAAPRKERS
jgi:hypothetical protein